MTDLTVANTIVQQLGGQRFRVMTGAKDFVGSDDGVSFRLPKAKDGINIVRVKLTANDDYTVRFERLYKKGGLPEFKLVNEVTGVYAENLRTVFTNNTGLYTSLGG